MFCTERDTLYNKLFTKILDSSIWLESDGTRLVWLTLLAAMDQDGFCEYASVPNLAHRARVTLEAAQQAVDILEAPDPYSADPDNDGRRIERVDGGWIVLNAVKYREVATADQYRKRNRERQRRYRERHDAQTTTDVTPRNVTSAKCNASVTPSEACAYAESGTPESTMPPSEQKQAPDTPKAPESADVTAAFEAYRTAIQPKARFLPAARDKIKRRLDTYRLPELLQAVSNFAADAWYMQHNAHRGAAWFYHSDDRIEQFINLVPRAPDTDSNRKDNEHGSNGRHKPEPQTGHRVSALTGFSRRLD